MSRGGIEKPDGKQNHTNHLATARQTQNTGSAPIRAGGVSGKLRTDFRIEQLRNLSGSEGLLLDRACIRSHWRFGIFRLVRPSRKRRIAFRSHCICFVPGPGWCGRWNFHGTGDWYLIWRVYAFVAFCDASGIAHLGHLPLHHSPGNVHSASTFGTAAAKTLSLVTISCLTSMGFATIFQ